MPGPSPRPPLPPKLIRLAASLLEAGLLLCAGVMLLDGAIQDADSEGPKHFPIRVGVSAIPILIVVVAYGVQRFLAPRRFSFMLAGAVVCALGGALRAGIEPLQRFWDALRGFAVGGFLMGFLMTVDDDSTTLLEGGAQPWRELLMAGFLVTFGVMPSAIFGGFVLALPTIIVGIIILVRCIRYDARIVAPRRSIGAATRVFIAMLLGLLAVGFLIVCPRLSLGMLHAH